MKRSIGATGQIAKWVDRTAHNLKKYRWNKPNIQPTSNDVIAAKQLLMDREPEFVPLTPIGKNMLKQFDGDIKLKLIDKVSKAEKFLLQSMYEIGVKHYGPVDVKYSTLEKAPAVDFWRNFFKMGREVTVNTRERRLKGLEVYEDIVNLPFNVTDKVLEEAVNIILAMLPFKIKSTKKTDPNWKPPFQGYHTNVGYPYFRNDRSTLGGKSFDNITRSLAEKLPLSDIINYPAIMIGRDQRSGFEYNDGDVKDTIKNLKEFKQSKARVVWATSRLANLQFIKIVQPLIDSAKKTNLFTGYNDKPTILTKAMAMNKYAKDNSLLIYGNDWPQFDAHLTLELNAVKTYIYDQIISDNYGKKLNEAMTIWGSKMPIIYDVIGSELKQKFYVGGQKSGEIDTNLGGGIKNAFMTIATQLTMNFEFYRKMHWQAIRMNVPSLMVMGDDSVTIFKDMKDVERFSEVAEQLFGTKVNPNKGEKFFFFLQNRLNEQGYFTTPSPRVVSKSVWIERPKGLGPYGWAMAQIMKLEPIKHNPEFNDVVRLLARFDKYKLGTYSHELNRRISSKEFIRSLALESRDQGLTTKERLFDGDPNKEYLFNKNNKQINNLKNGEPTEDFIGDMFSRIEKALY